MKLEVEEKSYFSRLEELTEELLEEIETLRTSGREFAEKDNEAKKAKSKAFLLSPGKNADERWARADAKWSDQRLTASLAEVDNNTSLEKVRSLRTIISALQTIVSARKAEAEAIKYEQYGSAS